MNELALRIQQGETDLTEQLWKETRRLIYKLAYRFSLRQSEACASAGVTQDDLAQAGFLAMLDAVKAFEPETGYKFTSYLNYPLKNRFNEAVGFRRTRREPLNYCTSLDAPVGEESDAALVDIIPDKNAGAAFEDCEHDLYIMQLRAMLDECLDTLPVQRSDVLRRRYYDGESLQTIAEVYGVSMQWIQELEQKSLRNLRNRPLTRRKLMPFLHFHPHKPVNDYATGYQRFRNSGYSSVELAALRHTAAPQGV